ncbi:multidrug ABC transporter ATP-binding protein [Tersicoccus phoenicis]|uniref:Multidrug ABC transporter ATP-binding protein n=1 Tax=Tersicoccus phoenicis TaxID=554083 RepID=A0A1R1L6X8_9MICC|nr:ABC transporter ATP-binding protein [Tersicoccus phoenicis]OMH23300.1 multidrug ABC transporter ATP-binding protein [Tersicoccus phoenicis]
MIQVEHLTKRFGEKVAVDDLSFTVRTGTVTGFLGPNGAGKSTTMRVAVGLDRPTAGSVTFAGKRYQELASPLREVGTLLEARAVHPGRTARNHLRALATTHGISTRRVDEVLGLTGLSDVAGKRVGGFSLGMGQRLGIATAMLGDPGVLVLDEPVNGLDPEGVIWVRNLARALAAEGRTVLISSHLMSEMAQTADHLVVIAQGRLMADSPIDAMLDGEGQPRVLVRSPDVERLGVAIAGDGVHIEQRTDGGLLVTGRDPLQISRAALEHGLLLSELTPMRASLEDAYLRLTHDHVDYRAAEPVAEGK